MRSGLLKNLSTLIPSKISYGVFRILKGNGARVGAASLRIGRRCKYSNKQSSKGLGTFRMSTRSGNLRRSTNANKSPRLGETIYLPACRSGMTSVSAATKPSGITTAYVARTKQQKR